MFIGGFFLPLFIIALFYILIVLLLRKNEIFLTYKIRNVIVYKDESSFVLENKNLCAKEVRNYSENLNAIKPLKNSSNNSKKEIKLIKMVSLIILMFVVAWTPYAVVTLAAQLCTNIETYINPYTTSLPALFAKTSSIYNPLIYTLNNKDFRRFFINCFLKKFKFF